MTSSATDGWVEARELRLELKAEWAEMWRTKFEDETAAEGVSRKDFERLFVEGGEILFASRDFKPPSFKEILEKHMGSEMTRRVDLDPTVGGWRKFAKEHLSSMKPVKQRERPELQHDLSQQQRKNGRGWLNKAKIIKKASSYSFGY